MSSAILRPLMFATLCGLSLGFSLPPSAPLANGAGGSPGARAGKVAMRERTYIMVKPDGVQRGLVGTIIGRFEQRGYKLQALKLYQPSKGLIDQHYCDLVEKPFYPGMRDYMLSGPVACMVWEGKEAVKMGRQMLGATNPMDSMPGTIRGDFSLEVGRNICHGSDCVENAEKEIALWFPEGVCDWSSHSDPWVYELDRTG